MLDDEREDLGRQIMELALKKAAPAEIRAQAKQAKAQLFAEYLEIWRIVNHIDNLVITYANDPTWLWGLQLEPPQSVEAPSTSATKGSERTRRVVQIAADIASRGNRTVAAKDIARRLKAEGEQLPEKDLATAAGNILARADGWRRVKPGVYTPVGVQQEMSTVS